MSNSLVEPTNRKRSAARGNKDRRTGLLAISSLLFAVAPKCPICFLAYFGIFGVATASVSAYRTWLPPIIGFWLVLTIAVLAFQRRGKRRYGPAALGLVAALLLMTGKFAIDSQVVIFSGIIALLAAAVWRSRIQQSISAECSQCEELPLLHSQ